MKSSAKANAIFNSDLLLSLVVVTDARNFTKMVKECYGIAGNDIGIGADILV